jgi:hypothetical protein
VQLATTAHGFGSILHKLNAQLVSKLEHLRTILLRLLHEIYVLQYFLSLVSAPSDDKV